MIEADRLVTPKGSREDEILGDDGFYLEIHNHGTVDEEFVRQGMGELSRLTGIPLVAANDCHFHRRDDLFELRWIGGKPEA